MDLNHRGPVGRRIYSPVQSTAMRYLQKAVGILLRHALDVTVWWSEPRFKATRLRQLLKLVPGRPACVYRVV